MAARLARRPFVLHDRPLFFAHRGGSLLAPENTMPAFEKGTTLGADALELDVHPTRDGEIIVLHDLDLDRTTNGSGPVAALTLDELRQFDAGYRFTPDGGATYPFRGQGIAIPTLAQVYAAFPTVRINIEIKASDPVTEASVWRIIQEHDAADRTMVGSFPEGPLRRFRALTGGSVATSASEPEIREFLAATYTLRASRLRPAYDALQIPPTWRHVPVTTRPVVRAAHDLGLDVHIWTIDSAREMRRLLAMGVDGLMSDRPDVLAEVLATWKR
jgi:glycerophosphoryl diester phosphodiesterase